MLFDAVPDHFEMIFERDDTYQQVTDADGNGTLTESSYALLPGIGVLVRRNVDHEPVLLGYEPVHHPACLAAQTLQEAQKGVAFAAVIKILLPIIVVVPGIAALVLGADIPKADSAFAWVLTNHVPVGIKGIVFAGLVAAVGSSISSMVNSASTIFTIDIYKDLIDRTASESKLVNVGRISGAVALLIGAILAPRLDSLGQVFQYIQEYTGFVSPGVFAVFLFGMFWKRTTSDAAFYTIIVAIPLSLGIRWLMPDLPFLDRMGVAFLLCCISLVLISGLQSRGGSPDSTKPIYRYIIIGVLAMVAVSTGLKMGITGPLAAESTLGWVTLLSSCTLIGILYGERGVSDRKAIELESGLFQTSSLFNVVAFGVVLFLTGFYIYFADTIAAG